MQPIPHPNMDSPRQRWKALDAPFACDRPSGTMTSSNSSSHSSAGDSPIDSGYGHSWDSASPRLYFPDVAMVRCASDLDNLKQNRSAQRRQAHIVSEQRRRTDINQHLDTLRHLVPEAENSDPKALTLSKTIEHLRHCQAILHVLNFDVMNLPHPQDVAHFGPPMARTVVVPKNRLALPELGVGPASRAPPSPGNKRKLSLLDLCT